MTKGKTKKSNADKYIWNENDMSDIKMPKSKTKTKTKPKTKKG